MANYVIWLDSEKANIFELKATGVEKSHLAKVSSNHHTHDPKDHMKDAGEEHFFKNLSGRVNDGKQILLVGPGLAKNHFKTHLENHHAGDLGKNIVGVEHVTTPRISKLSPWREIFLRATTFLMKPSKTFERKAEAAP